MEEAGNTSYPLGRPLTVQCRSLVCSNLQLETNTLTYRHRPPRLRRLHNLHKMSRFHFHQGIVQIAESILTFFEIVLLIAPGAEGLVLDVNVEPKCDRPPCEFDAFPRTVIKARDVGLRLERRRRYDAWQQPLRGTDLVDRTRLTVPPAPDFDEVRVREKVGRHPLVESLRKIDSGRRCKIAGGGIWPWRTGCQRLVQQGHGTP